MKYILHKYSVVFLVLFFTLTVLRIYGFWHLSDYSGVNKTIHPLGFVRDASFIAKLLMPIALLQWGINRFSIQKNGLLFYVVSILFLLVEISLLEYFTIMGVLLDEVLYTYSFSELKMIVGVGSLRLSIFLVMLLVILFFFYVIYYFNRKIKENDKINVVIGGIAAILLFIPSVSKTSNEEFNQSTSSKTGYFLERSFQYLTEKKESQSDFKTLSPNDFYGISHNFYGGEVEDENYPFFHSLPEKSELEKYLDKTSDGKTPNIVYIICEGLSAYFIGDSAGQTGHIMPFLDSLSNKSLYWPNFLSISDRTYQVLPASLASVPMMTKGRKFMEMEYPRHFSLMNLLYDSYFSRFYCGAYLSFTQMDRFMEYHHTHYQVKDWEPQFSKELNGKEMGWGYPDKDLFEKSWVDYEKQKLDSTKRLDIILTVSTHPPFEFPEKQKFVQQAKKLLMNNQKKYNEDYSRILNRIEEFVTYYYLDEQLKNYFLKAQQQPDFENTIFLIFGDHGAQMMSTDELSNYKIPLLIYSPLVKDAKKFRGVSTQLDLAPTLLNYLRLNYLPDLPQKTSFLGKELSFSEEYEMNRTIFLGTNVRSDEYFIKNEFYKFHLQVFKIGNNLSISEINQKDKFNDLMNERNKVRSLVNYVVFNDKFLPKEYYDLYTPKDKRRLLAIRRLPNLKTEEGNQDELYLATNVFQLDTLKTEISVEFTVEYKGKDTAFLDLPKIAYSVHDSKGESLFWGKALYLESRSIVPDSWNSLQAKGYIRINQNVLQEGEQYEIKYYVLNTDLKAFELKNAEVRFMIEQ